MGLRVAGAALFLGLLPGCFLINTEPERPPGLGRGDVLAGDRGVRADSGADEPADVAQDAPPLTDPADGLDALDEGSEGDSTGTDLAGSDSSDGDGDHIDTAVTDSEVADVAESSDATDASGEADGVDGGCAEANACGGCGELSAAPLTPCGDTCGDGTWTCNGEGSEVTCEGESVVNACDFCGELPGVRGEQCSCDALGDAVWTCDGDELSCVDGDDSPDDATDLGGLTDAGAFTWPGMYTDSVTDVDWFELRALDLDGFALEPGATVETSDSDGINYEVCIFYRFDTSRIITPFRCSTGVCSHYDAGDDVVIRSGDDICLERAGFDPEADIYGCCTRAFSNEPPQWIVQMAAVDEAQDNTGTLLIRVSTPTNTVEDGCREYDLVIRL